MVVPHNLQSGEEMQETRGALSRLVFEGLDTFATIYVNGHEVGKTANMLMSHAFDVTIAGT